MCGGGGRGGVSMVRWGEVEQWREKWGGWSIEVRGGGVVGGGVWDGCGWVEWVSWGWVGRVNGGCAR